MWFVYVLEVLGGLTNLFEDGDYEIDVYAVA